MRPSPRQQQMARLRARAVGTGLRVRVTAARPGPGTHGIDYLLPWLAEDPARVHAKAFASLVRCGDQWLRGVTSEPLTDAPMLVALRQLPDGVSELNATGEGLAARWDERGDELDVERIGNGLRALRQAWLSSISHW